jgi:hypothetical protein
MASYDKIDREKGRLRLRYALENCQRAFPELRLLQLIENALSEAISPHRIWFYIEDEELARYLENYLERHFRTSVPPAKVMGKPEKTS